MFSCDLTAMKPKHASACTLSELMIVVAIVGVAEDLELVEP